MDKETPMSTQPAPSRGWLITGAAAAAAVLALAACSSSGATTGTTTHASSATTPSGPVHGAFGQTAYSPLGDGGVAAVTVSAPTFAPTTDPSPQAGATECVIFQVAVINNDTRPMNFPGNWSVRSQDGHSYNFTLNCNVDQVDDRNNLPSDGIQPLATAAGQVAFEAPEHGTLTYTPPASNLDTIEWVY